MVNLYEGNLLAQDLKIAIVISRFNEFIGRKLLEGALDAIKRHGGEESNIDLIWVPGAFETPLAAKKLAKSGKYNGIICLGAVIRGSTPHFDYVCAEATKGIASAMMETETPIAFGILTTDNIEQAIERAGTKAGNKGFDAAMSAIEMANLLKNL